MADSHKQNKTFDWDQYLEKTPYNKVLNSMSEFRRIIPTMFSPDGKLLYLKSHDIDVDISDVSALIKLLENTYDSLMQEIKTFKWSVEAIYFNQLDFTVLMAILYNNEALPEKFGGEDYHPEKYIMKAWEDAGRLKE